MKTMYGIITNIYTRECIFTSWLLYQEFVTARIFKHSEQE